MSEWKESHVGKFPSYWDYCYLKDICTKIGSGATPRGGKEAYHKSGISLIRSQNVLDFTFSHSGLAFIDKKQADELSNVEVFENDVLLNITGDSVARVCQPDKEILPARVNQHVMIIRPDISRLNHKFLKYSLVSNRYKNYLLNYASSGATRKAITKTMVEEIEIFFPEITEQQKIASILSSLDDKIELNNQINETLEEMAQTLFKRWFVDFEFPNEDGFPYKSSGGEMVPSELGEIPKGWEVGNLSDISVIFDFMRVPLSKNEREKRKGLYPYYGAASIAGFVDDYLFDGDYILLGEDGIFWLFGGYGLGDSSSVGFLNDLWCFDSSSKEWSWISGASDVNTPGKYGLSQISSVTDYPGARKNSCGWADDDGNLWVFGGYGYDSSGNKGRLNDLWKYEISSGIWTWMSGSTSKDSLGSGLGENSEEFSMDYVPSARMGSHGWIDNEGDLWLFSGSGKEKNVDDIWKFDVSKKQWAWMRGNSAAPIYNNLGITSKDSTPGGSRESSASWVDQEGNLWIFGGGNRNDLWKLDKDSLNWTWKGGSSETYSGGSYSDLGLYNSDNMPHSMNDSSSWVDLEGKLWLFGGHFTSRIGGSQYYYNTLWCYDISINQWALIKNDGRGSAGTSPGTYGTLGVSSVDNLPSGRSNGASWADSTGKLWFWGGVNGNWLNMYKHNDMWMFEH